MIYARLLVTPRAEFTASLFLILALAVLGWLRRVLG